MKIGILTFSKENNYGANLQCYALSKVLQQCGHEVSIIDIQLYHTLSFKSKMVNMIQTCIFDSFRKKHLNLFTKRYPNSEAIKKDPPSADFFIVGSDQVWNYEITSKLDPKIYFFSFLPKGTPRISYAASFGFDKWELNEIEDYRQLLKQFNAVSVREGSGCKICEETFGISATEVLDPTLLLESYDDLCGTYDGSRRTDNLVCFRLYQNETKLKTLRNFSNEKGMNLVSLFETSFKKDFKVIPFLTVKQWLNYIRYAKFVVTSSFHCMVFCILFKKSFVVISSRNVKRNERKYNLLQKLGLQDRFCPNDSQLESKLSQMFEKKTDYNDVFARLTTLRTSSLDFLLDSITQIEEKQNDESI